MPEKISIILLQDLEKFGFENSRDYNDLYSLSAFIEGPLYFFRDA